ncbi:unnamed protein product, partial [Vitis vinifera]|uniref:Uncharacterized protein n=1 Tax=Vitis vinifera TaxID=29760 RepID=D7U3T4_VITVI
MERKMKRKEESGRIEEKYEENRKRDERGERKKRKKK